MLEVYDGPDDESCESSYSLTDPAFMQAPYPWFGGKSRVASEVWKRFGDTPNYIEPFFGSGAVLLKRPHAPRVETVNDKDGFVSNFWRSIQRDPETIAEIAMNPVNECDLTARHIWLRSRAVELEMDMRLCADPEYYDSEIAGWWVWGLCSWIGGGWCGPSGEGPWCVVDGKLIRVSGRKKSSGISKRRPDIGSIGVQKKMPHVGDQGRGVSKKRPHISRAGQGIVKQMPHVADHGRGAHRKPPGDMFSLECLSTVEDRYEWVLAWMEALQNRMFRVRVTCGDWSRITGTSPTTHIGLSAVFLDPPYSLDIRSDGCYRADSGGLAQDVLDWCMENGDNPKLRIALCGYDGEHNILESLGWSVHGWSANGGYAHRSDDGTSRGMDNRHKERIWFSPHCLPVDP